MQNKSFGRLLKMVVSSIAINEGKAAVSIEEELGGLMGVTGASIQRYKNGYIPPNPEMLEIFVKAGVSRAFLSKEWAASFLREGNHPDLVKVIHDLFGDDKESRQGRPSFNNLPAPSYSQFIERSVPFKEIVEGLGRRSAVVLLVSMGGFGKSSIAREIAEKALHGNEGVQQFDAAVWVSDKGREGTTTLSIVLDEIAHTLENAGIVALPFKDKKREVEKLLRHYKVLLVLDNAETITDMSLFSWLVNIPEPSKTIVTARDRNEIFFNNTTWVKLGGLTESEAEEFIASYAESLNLPDYSDMQSQKEELMRISGGNPKALMMMLGYIKHKNLSLTDALDEVRAAKGDLFDDLFHNCWNALSLEPKNIFLAMSFFPEGASPGALEYVSGVSGARFQSELSRLMDMSLIDAERSGWDSPVLYTVHQLPLVFARARLSEFPVFEKEARERWVSRYRDIAGKIGFAWKDLNRLSILDAPGESGTMLDVIEWCYNNEWYDDVVEISRNARYYYYVRGFWSSERSINLLRANAAGKQRNSAEEFDALVYHINIAAKQCSFEEVERYLPRLEALISGGDIPAGSIAAFQHAKAIYFMEKGEYQPARQLWEKILSSRPNSYDYEANVYKRWAATCLFRMGKVAESRKAFLELVKESRDAGLKRGMLSAGIGLAISDLALGNTENIESEIDALMNEATAIRDLMYIGQVYSIYGEYFSVKNDRENAVEYYHRAIEVFRKLGFMKGLRDAEQKLSTLPK
jgi:tetratricopeptide (TPR) repeat protein